MMKKLILLTFLPVWLFAQGPKTDIKSSAIPTVTTTKAEDAAWLKNYDEALSDAKEEQRNVLVYFTGSDWCSPCIKLKTDLFDTSEFKTIATNYTLLYVDMPRNRGLLSAEQLEHNSDLMVKINKKGVFPLFVILNEKGAELGQYAGYSMDGNIQAHLDLLDKHKE